MPSSKKRKPKKQNNMVNEPLADYLKSERFNESFRKVEISSMKEQEEANYLFWLSITPEQRLELHYEMISQYFKVQLNKSRKTVWNKIIFDL